MQIGPLVQARLIERENRFRAAVSVAGRRASAHVPNSGRLRELLTPGRPIWLAPVDGATRKTAYDLALVEMPEGLVSIDARLPNALVAEALAAGQLPWAGNGPVRREVALGESRIDLRVVRDDAPCWIEVKSVTLVREGTAMFPDAPTVRGARHVRELMGAVNRGEAAAVVFVVQRADALRFRPYAENDPNFAAALLAAQKAGVQIHAYRCAVSAEELYLSAEIPVSFPGDKTSFQEAVSP